MAAVQVIRGFHGGAGTGPGDPEPNRASIPQAYDPIDVFAPGPWPGTAAPWLDVQEDPEAPGLPLSLVQEPGMPRPDIGAEPIVGPFMPWERGPVTAFGMEENSGRTMRFPTNPVMGAREPGRVGSGESSYLDELAANVAANRVTAGTDAGVTSNLLLYR